MLLGSLSYVFIVGSNAGYTMFRGSVKGNGSNAGYTIFRGRVEGYWLHTPFAIFPLTSPPVRHREPSHFNWSLLTFSHYFSAYSPTYKQRRQVWILLREEERLFIFWYEKYVVL